MMSHFMMSLLCALLLTMTGSVFAAPIPVAAFNDPSRNSSFFGQRNDNTGYINGAEADMLDDPGLATSWNAYAENAGTGGSASVVAEWTLEFSGPTVLTSITSDLMIWAECSATKVIVNIVPTDPLADPC